MGERIRGHIRSNVIGYVALFVALSGTAYAAGTIDSSDIVDESILSQDVKNGEVKTPDLAQNSVGTGRIADLAVQNQDLATDSVTSDKVLNGTLRALDIAPESLGGGRIADGSVTRADVLDASLTGIDIANNSLKGADVDEGSLNGALIPGIATSGLVKSSGIVTVDDPAGGGLTQQPLLTSGPFTVTGLCTDEDVAGNDVAEIYISSTANDWAMTSDAVGGTSTLFLDNTTSSRISQLFSVNDDSDITAGDYTGATSSKFLAGETFTGMNIMGSDCVFGVTGIG